ncbi:hypothetical protein BDV09DRAFT_169485 [Aspergillus tetrazonus]
MNVFYQNGKVKRFVVPDHLPDGYEEVLRSLVEKNWIMTSSIKANFCCRAVAAQALPHPASTVLIYGHIN